MKKILKILFVIINIILFFIAVAWLFQSKAKAVDKDPTKVRLENPVRGELIEFISATGEITPKRKVDISAKVSARIIEIPDEPGLHVTKGDPTADPPVEPTVVVRLDDRDLSAALRSAQARRSAQAAQINVSETDIDTQKANIAECQVQLQLARQHLARQEALWESKDISEADFDDVQSKVAELTAHLAGLENSVKSARLGLDVLRFNLEAADAEIEQAREALSYTTITTPIDGVITRINAEQGELVMTGTMNNAGTVIMTIADLSQMIFKAQVDEANIGKVELGQHVKVRLQSWPDTVFTGIVRQVALTYNTGRNDSKYYETEILMEQDDRLIFSGMTGDADIEIKQYQDILKVPSQSIVSRKVDELPAEICELLTDEQRKKTFATLVYRYNDGKAVATPVSIGPSDVTDTIILNGVSPEDHIITGPYKVLEKIKHDQKVIDEKEAEEKETAETEKSGADDQQSNAKNGSSDD